MTWSRRHVVWGLVILATTCWVRYSFADEFSAERLDASGATGGLVSDAGVGTRVISDDFDDNRRDPMWSLDVDVPATCWLDETSERLELQATSKADWSSAFYLAEGWAVEPTWDFSLSVDYRQDAELGDATWLSVVLTPDVDNRGSRHVAFGVGTDDAFPYLWVEAIDEAIQYSRSTARRDDEGTLYVSYDAYVDELYFSDRGYGPENAWVTLKGIPLGAWAGLPITVGIGGGSNGVEIDSGQAFFDNFVLEAGTSVPEQLAPVYRFWSPVLLSHFYTIDAVERDRVMKKYTDVWVFEEEAFHVGAEPFDSGLVPVYRFWSPETGMHQYTIDEEERDRLIKEGKSTWVFEGIAFYVYPEGQQPKETKPVYRFLNRRNGAQFYTISEQERDRVLKQYPDVFTFEGIAFYAYE